MAARENKCQISENDIFSKKSSEFYQFLEFLWNLKFIVSLNIRIQKQFPLSVFVFIDSLVVSASQDAGGYAISRRNILELHLGCHTCWLSYFTLVCLWFGRTVGRAYGHVISKISRMGRLTHFLGMGLRSRALFPGERSPHTIFPLFSCRPIFIYTAESGTSCSEWEPKQITAKLPEFFRFVKEVQLFVLQEMRTKTD